MKKKFLGLLLCCSMLAGMLAGCGGDSTTTDDSATTDNAAGSSDTQTPSEPTGNSSGKEITYWSMWNSTEGQAEIIQAAADAYEEKTGIHVNIEWKGRDVKTLIGAALDAGEKVDIFDDDYQRVCVQDGKYLADLTDMAAAADYEKHIMPVLLNAAKSWSDGKLICMPYQPYTTGVWYNKELWKNAGLTDDDIPETWDELIATCKKIKDDGQFNAMTCNEEEVNLLMGFQLARYIGQEKVLDVYNNQDWANVPEALQAATDIQTLFKDGYMSEYAPANGKTGQEEIAYGESIMMLGASWVPNEISQSTSTEVDWGFFPWPAVKGGVDGTEASMVGSQGFGIVEKSEMKQEAFDFALTICVGDYDLQMAQKVSSIPADVDNTEWPAAVMGAEPYFKNMTKDYMWAVGLQSNPDLTTAVQENVVKLTKEELTPQEFVDSLTQ